MKIELIYDSDCPNVEKARRQLKEALAQSGLEESWKEWDRSARESPEYTRRYGSPTILVEGRDVAGEEPGDGSSSCRVYEGSGGRLEGVPSVKSISLALSSRLSSFS